MIIRNLSALILSVSLVALITSCSGGLENDASSDSAIVNYLKYDSDAGMTKKDYKKLLEGKKVYKDDDRKKFSGYKPLSSILTTTKPLSFENNNSNDPLANKLITMKLKGNVPLKEVIINMFDKVGADVEIDPGITGGVIFSVEDKPFYEVLDIISRLGNLRYKKTKGVILVERDRPYVKSYSIDFLSLVRSATSTVNVSTNSGGAAGATGTAGGATATPAAGAATTGATGGTTNSGMTTAITMTNTDDFWAALESGIKQILTEDAYSTLEESTEDTATITTSSTTVTSNNATTLLTVPDGAIRFNKKAGIVSIIATERAHKKIQDYINLTKRKATAQVLIEAKIVELDLNDQFQFGINWDYISTSQGAGSGIKNINIPSNFTTGGSGINPITSTISLSKMFRGINLNGAISLLETFGTTKVLSNPRITALNNQTAILTFATNKVFFDISVSNNAVASTTGTVNTGTIQGTMRTTPEGIIVAIQPSINIDTKEITMIVRPTITRVTRDVPNPTKINTSTGGSGSGATNTDQNTVPETAVKEIDSTLRLRSGELMAIGGFTEQKRVLKETGVPFLSKIPILGYLFKAKSNVLTTTETLILIKATIIEPGSNMNDRDSNFLRDVNKSFGNDKDYAL